MGIKWIIEPPNELLVRVSKNLRSGESLEKIMIILLQGWAIRREEQEIKKSKSKK